MNEQQADLSRPIRVVVFGGGPTLDRALARFATLLEAHPEIEFLGGFCESGEQGLIARVQDRWRRRGILSVPLLLSEAFDFFSRLLAHPLSEIQLQRKIARISDRIHCVSDIHAQEVLERVRALGPDLGLIYGGPILRPTLFQIPRLGTLGIHHGKVPEYRGKKTTFWAIFNGEQSAGVTIQRVNAGLDSGDIVKKGEVPVGRRSLREVWSDLEQLGFELYIEAIVAVKRGTAQSQPQAGKKGKLYKDPKAADVLRYWGRQFMWRLNS